MTPQAAARSSDTLYHTLLPQTGFKMVSIVSQRTSNSHWLLISAFISDFGLCNWKRKEGKQAPTMILASSPRLLCEQHPQALLALLSTCHIFHSRRHHLVPWSVPQQSYGGRSCWTTFQYMPFPNQSLWPRGWVALTVWDWWWSASRTVTAWGQRWAFAGTITADVIKTWDGHGDRAQGKG